MQRDDLHARAVRALAAAWERASLAPESVAQWGAELGLGAAAGLEALAQARLSPAWAARLAAHPAAAPMVSVLRANQGSARGDALRRAGILAGVLDAEDGLRELLAQGALVPRQATGRQPFVLATELGRRTFLGRELELPEELAAWLVAQADFPSPSPRGALQDHEVAPRAEQPTKTLEHNLLRVVYVLEREPLPLNRDGSPHRRALGRLAQALAWEQGESADLHGAEAVERLHHLLSLAAALGLLEVHFQALFVAPELGEGFFGAAEPERDRLLWKAWRGAGWSELGAWGALRPPSKDGEPRRAAVAQEAGAARLAGIRQQVQDDLRRLGGAGWFRLDAAKEALLALDRGYLAQGLDGAFGAKVHEPGRFVEAVLALALPWMGFARVGRCADGGAALRWTARGRRALGLDPPQPEEARAAPWVVQPNLEVAVFLDEVRLDALARLYRFGAREVERSDRVARFVLEPEPIQRAYGRGVDADEVIGFLQAGARAALPASVEFALRDWDRVHRRVTIYAGGALLECDDPDKLDALLDALTHAKGPERDARRLGVGEAFLPSASDEALAGVARALDASRVQARVLDLGAEQAPLVCLRHVEGEVFEVLPGGLDLVTAAELPWVAQAEEAGPSGAARWRVDPAKVTARWGGQAWPRLEAFLRTRLAPGAWAGALRLRLRALLEPQRAGRVEEGAELLLVSDPEVADALLEIPGVEEWVRQRLGPSALWLERGGAAPVKAWLRRLALARAESP